MNFSNVCVTPESAFLSVGCGASVSTPGRVLKKMIGFSAGGAKDVNNFRENIKCGFMPQKTDITMEGIFYDYYFDTVNPSKQDLEADDKEALFYPSYSQGIALHTHLYIVCKICVELSITVIC